MDQFFVVCKSMALKTYHKIEQDVARDNVQLICIQAELLHIFVNGAFDLSKCSVCV